MSSGLPLKADIAQCSRHVSKVPQPDSCTQQTTGLFDHLVGANETWAQKSYDIEGGIRLLAGPLQVQ
jgi:hypothetical protein